MKTSQKKIAIIIGTRPEAIKLVPVYQAFKEFQEVEVEMVSTGQHKELIDPIFRFFDVFPDVQLEAGMPNQTLSSLTAKLVGEIDRYLTVHRPDCVIVQGDTTSSMIGSLVGFYHALKVAHVEAGLRTYRKDSPFPEEVNRKITSCIADFHFAPTSDAMDNLKKENCQGIIELVGNTVVDSLMLADQVITRDLAKYQSKYRLIFSNYDRVILITGHRRENFGEKFRDIFKTIIELAIENPNTGFLYPVHFNPNVRTMAYEMLGDIKNIFLIDPVSYDDMIFLIKSCYLVMTDSGGVQEECPSFGKPTIVLRETTERPEGVKAGCSILVGVREHAIRESFYRLMTDQAAYDRMSSVQNPYGDGNASKRICQIVMQNL